MFGHMWGYSLKFRPYLVGGWALPLWKMMEFISWDDDIPNSWGKSFKIPWFQTTNQQPIGLFSMVGTTHFQLPEMAIDHRNIPGLWWGFDGDKMNHAGNGWETRHRTCGSCGASCWVTSPQGHIDQNEPLKNTCPSNKSLFVSPQFSGLYPNLWMLKSHGSRHVISH